MMEDCAVGEMKGCGDEQAQALRRMTMEQRWRVAHALYASAREWKTCAQRALHSDWSEARIKESVRRSFLHVRR